MEKVDKKLILLCSGAVLLLIAVVVLICIFFFAPAPASSTPSVNTPSEISSVEESSDMGMGVVSQESSLPSSEPVSSEAESIPAPSLPASSQQVQVKPSSQAPKPVSKPSTPSKASSQPASSSKPVSSASSASSASSKPVSTNAEKLGWKDENRTLKLNAGQSKTYYLDIPSGSEVSFYAYDDNVKVSKSGNELTIKTSLNCDPYSDVDVQCVNKEGTEYVTYHIALEITLPTDSGSSFDYSAEYESTLLNMINSERARYNLPPLDYSDALCTGSQTRAAEIAVSFSPTRTDGTSFQTVYGDDAKNHTYVEFRTKVSSDTDAESIFYQWLNSSSNKSAILNLDYNEAGFGFWIGADEKLYVVAHLAI